MGAAEPHAWTPNCCSSCRTASAVAHDRRARSNPTRLVRERHGHLRGRSGSRDDALDLRASHWSATRLAVEKSHATSGARHEACRRAFLIAGRPPIMLNPTIRGPRSRCSTACGLARQGPLAVLQDFALMFYRRQSTRGESAQGTLDQFWLWSMQAATRTVRVHQGLFRDRLHAKLRRSMSRPWSCT